MIPPPKIGGQHLHAQHDTKTTLVLLPADGKAIWSLSPSLVSLLSDETVQLKKTYSCIHEMACQACESQKIISIDINHSCHQRSSPEICYDLASLLVVVLLFLCNCFNIQFNWIQCHKIQ